MKNKTEKARALLARLGLMPKKKPVNTQQVLYGMAGYSPVKACEARFGKHSGSVLRTVKTNPCGAKPRTDIYFRCKRCGCVYVSPGKVDG